LLLAVFEFGGKFSGGGRIRLIPIVSEDGGGNTTRNGKTSKGCAKASLWVGVTRKEKSPVAEDIYISRYRNCGRLAGVLISGRKKISVS